MGAQIPVVVSAFTADQLGIVEALVSWTPLASITGNTYEYIMLSADERLMEIVDSMRNQEPIVVDDSSLIPMHLLHRARTRPSSLS